LVNGTINLRAGLVVLILAPEVYWPIRQVSALFHAAEDGVAAADEIFEILDSPMKNGNIQISQFTSISWSDLTISYDGRREIHIPAGQLLPGKIYGLIGPSGSGKSTLISTLLGFTEVSSGQIIISTPEGNVPFEEVEKKSWRELLSWMPQEPHFKIGSVASIVGNQSLKSVGILESELPQGLETPIGGVMDGISFGQRRRLALLRAIDKKSPLLFLDEPTASVDDITEEEITSLINKIALENRIIVLSSHRQFTQSIMDEVIYMGES
jgi:ATP-binding cassette subfamily C protein CydCD